MTHGPSWLTGAVVLSVRAQPEPARRSGAGRSTATRRLADHVDAAERGSGIFGHTLEHVQSNHEGDLIEAVHQARGRAAAIVVNAGALTHTSWSLHDALAAFDGVVVELHISNPAAREPFRHTSVVAPVADGSDRRIRRPRAIPWPSRPCTGCSRSGRRTTRDGVGTAVRSTSFRRSTSRAGWTACGRPCPRPASRACSSPRGPTSAG